MLKSNEYLLYFYKFYVEPIDPYNHWLKHSLKTVFAALIAIIAGWALPLTEHVWLILCAVFLMQTYQGETVRARLFSIILAGAVSTVGVFLAILSTAFLPLTVALTMLGAFIAFYLTQYGPSISKTAIFTLVIIIVSTRFPGDWRQAAWYSLITFCGFLICYGVSFGIWPFRPDQQLKLGRKQCFYYLEHYFSRLMISVVIGVYDHDELARLKNEIVNNLQQNEKLIMDLNIPEQRTIIHQQQRLYEIIVALHRLLTRPASQVAFSVIYPKITQLRKAISINFERLGLRLALKQNELKGERVKPIKSLPFPLERLRAFSNEQISDYIEMFIYLIGKLHDTMRESEKAIELL